MQLTVLAVNPTEARRTTADISNEGVPPVGLTDLACPSVVARVWVARPYVQKGKNKKYTWSEFGAVVNHKPKKTLKTNITTHTLQDEPEIPYNPCQKVNFI